MRYWFDTEFMEDGHVIEPLSIGMVSEDGRELYLENGDADLSFANEWVSKNVLPHLEGGWLAVPLAQIAQEVLDFVGGDTRPVFWAYYGAYDWVLLCQLYGRMVDLPTGWPMFHMDLKQLAVDLGDPKLPPQSETEHHALADARWTRDAHLWLLGR